MNMKKIAVLFIAAVFAASTAACQQTSAQAPPKSPGVHATAAPAAAQPAAANGGNLDQVLSEMDTAAERFKNAQADFVWDQYQKVVNETDSQKGAIYFKRAGVKEVQMAVDISVPDQKYVLYNSGKMQVYQPKIDQVTQYTAGKNKEDFESFLFNVKLGGMEELNGVRVARLELAPKTDRLRNMFSQIFLWIDGARGVSVQQKFMEPSGDYRLAKYSNIRINQDIAGDKFKLKTTAKTKVVSPQGE